MSQKFLPGRDAWYASDSPSGTFSAVFEDDGETGYFYAHDRSAQQQPILDAVHIYNVANVSDRERESVVEILWSVDGVQAALLINGYPHAVIDFAERCSYCRTEYPPAGCLWRHGAWADELMQAFDTSA